MIYSIWLNAWDVAGRDPDRVLDELEELGLRGCRLGLAYHGGRMLLPTNPHRVVYEQEPGAVYFEADITKFGSLRPHVSDLAPAIRNFLRAADKRRFPVQAWTVLCHNDALGNIHPDCTIRNAFGERYSYALCPSQSQVAEYILTLCRQVNALEGVTALDLEALSFLGYEHNSLHDKQGVRLPAEVIWLLSICFCDQCQRSLPSAQVVQQAVSNYFHTGVAPDIDPDLRVQVCALRRRVLIQILTELRTLPVNLRFTPDVGSTGGKSALYWSDLEGLVGAVTLTFFNTTPSALHGSINTLPKPLPVKLQAGFVFHAPDCCTYEDVVTRLQLLRNAPITEIAFYSYSLAARWHFDWLGEALRKGAATH